MILKLFIQKKKTLKDANKDILVKGKNEIDADSSLVFKNQYSISSINSPQHYDQGTSNYPASYLNNEDMENYKDKDEI